MEVAINHLVVKQQLKHARLFPIHSRISTTTLKQRLITIKRILYVARGVKVEGKRAFPLSFYTEPTGKAV